MASAGMVQLPSRICGYLFNFFEKKCLSNMQGFVTKKNKSQKKVRIVYK